MADFGKILQEENFVDLSKNRENRKISFPRKFFSLKVYRNNPSQMMSDGYFKA